MRLQWGYGPTSYQSTTGANTAKYKSAYLLTPTKDKYKVSLLFGLRPGYYSQRLLYVDKEINLHNDDDDTFHSGEEHWNKCMAELHGADLEDSLWMFEEQEYADVVDPEESS